MYTGDGGYATGADTGYDGADAGYGDGADADIGNGPDGGYGTTGAGLSPLHWKINKVYHQKN